MDELNGMGDKLAEINREEINAPDFKIENWPLKDSVKLKLGLNFFLKLISTSGSLEKKRALELVSATIHTDGEVVFYTTENYSNYLVGVLVSVFFLVLSNFSFGVISGFWEILMFIVLLVSFCSLIFYSCKAIGAIFNEEDRQRCICKSCDRSLVNRLNAYSLFRATKKKIYKRARKQIQKNNKAVESFRDVLKDFSSTIVANELDK